MAVDDDLTELSEMQLDVLQEIGNVGAGNSATALSRLIQRRIEMNVPQVALVPIEDVPEFVGKRQATFSFLFRVRVLLRL